MRYLILILLISSSSFAETKSEKLIKLLEIKNEWDATISELTDIAKTPVSESDLDLYVIATEHNNNLDRIKSKTLSWEANKSTFVEFLDEKFTDSELDKIIAFYSSETGKKFLNYNDELTQQYQEQFKSKFEKYNELFQIESERYSKELDELMSSYEE